jgi:hypothetical protein
MKRGELGIWSLHKETQITLHAGLTFQSEQRIACVIILKAEIRTGKANFRLDPAFTFYNSIKYLKFGNMKWLQSKNTFNSISSRIAFFCLNKVDFCLYCGFCFLRKKDFHFNGKICVSLLDLLRSEYLRPLSVLKTACCATQIQLNGTTKD